MLDHQKVLESVLINILKSVDEVSYLMFHSYSMQLIPTHMRIGLKSKHMKALNPEF